MTNSKLYTVTILIKPSRVNGLGISSGLIHDEKMNIVTDYVCQWLSVAVCKSVSKKSSRINKFLVVYVLAMCCSNGDDSISRRKPRPRGRVERHVAYIREHVSRWMHAWRKRKRDNYRRCTHAIVHHRSTSSEVPSPPSALGLSVSINFRARLMIHEMGNWHIWHIKRSAVFLPA